MKFNLANLITVGALAFALVLNFGVSNVAAVNAPQMGDMPYDLHFIEELSDLRVGRYLTK